MLARRNHIFQDLQNKLIILDENVPEYVEYLKSRTDIDKVIHENILRLTKIHNPLGFLDKNKHTDFYIQELKKYSSDGNFKYLSYINVIYFAIISGDMELLDKILSLSNIANLDALPNELFYVISACLTDSFEVFIRNFCAGQPEKSLKNTNFGAQVLYKSINNDECDPTNFDIAFAYGASLNMNCTSTSGGKSPYPLCAALERENYISEITFKLIVDGAPTTYSGMDNKGEEFQQPLFYCRTPQAVSDLLSFGNVDLNTPNVETGKTFLHEIITYSYITPRSPDQKIGILKILAEHRDILDLEHRDFRGKNIFDDDLISKKQLDDALKILNGLK